MLDKIFGICAAIAEGATDAAAAAGEDAASTMGAGEIALQYLFTFATHGLQPTRLLRPWEFPGKSTGNCGGLCENLSLL